MSPDAPPAVARDPGHPHLIQRFTVGLRTNGSEIRVRGDVWWIPGPSPWLWVVIAGAVAVAVIALARTRHGAAAIGTALVVALVAAVLHAAGSWTPATTSFANRLAGALPTLGAAALGVVALVVLARRGLRAAAPLVVFAGLFLGIAIGLADVSALHRSQLPTDLARWLDRLAIALALGAGIGLTVGAAFHVADRTPSTRRGPPGRRPAPVRQNENQSQSMISG
jgi:hypothetical protein